MVFAVFLGMCSYLAVSKKVSTAVGLGAAVIFVLAVTVPLNPSFTAHELEHYLTDAEPRVFVVAPERRAAVADLARHHGVVHLETLGVDELQRRQEDVERLLDADGVTYRNLESGDSQAWTLDAIPLLVPSEEWAAIEAGVDAGRPVRRA